MKEIDFIAQLKFLSTEDGGRLNPAHSGYRPHIEFNGYPEYWTSGQQNYKNNEIAIPGKTIVAEISIIATEYFTGRLSNNMKFIFCEGSKKIGKGTIIEIVNSKLLRPKSVDEKSININYFPSDILEKIKKDYNNNDIDVIRSLQNYIINNAEGRSHRIIRGILMLSEGKVEKVKEYIKCAEEDWRDILFWSEYVDREKNDPRRIRNFNKPFGDEIIQ